ncbi:MAG: hypothetical protein NTZ05_14520 [Chloroflexi bacterium]|nr:hypothetical protein [Chloroflexota bacterium]
MAPSAAVIVAAVLLASTVSYYCVERPFLNGGSQVVAWLANLQKRSLRVG